MDDKKLDYYKKKLINERRKVEDLLLQMKRNETIDSKSEISSELSFYDNHPSDLASEWYDMERGMAFKQNEVLLLEKIDKAISRIENDTYGTCKTCGKPINEERLEFIPYAENCVECQQKLNDRRPSMTEDRPSEEYVLEYTMKRGYNKYTTRVGFDLEDSYDAVQNFDKRRNVPEYFYEDEYDVDPMDKISNSQYIDQLPD